MLTTLTPVILVGVAGLCFLVAAVVLRERVTAEGWAPATAPRVRLRLSRQALGLGAGGLLALMLIGMVEGAGLQGLNRTMGWLSAGIIVWTVGVVIPRIPQVRLQRRVRSLRQCVPGMIRDLQIYLQTETLNASYRQYAAFVEPQRALLQDLVRQAVARQKTQPTATLAKVVADLAGVSGCVELAQVTASLARAERTGGPQEAVAILRDLGETLDHQLEQDHKALVAKRKLMVIAATGLGVVVGLLGGILYLIVAGSNTGGVL